MVDTGTPGGVRTVWYYAVMLLGRNPSITPNNYTIITSTACIAVREHSLAGAYCCFSICLVFIDPFGSCGSSPHMIRALSAFS